MAAVAPPSSQLIVAGEAQQYTYAKGSASPTGRTFITSEVFPDPVEWWQRSLLIPHELLRCGMMDMERVLSPKYFPGTPQQDFKVKNFFKWYNEFFFAFTHLHHDPPPPPPPFNEPDAEEEIMIPVCARPLLARRAAHSSSDSPLRAIVADFVQRMKGHLREEEEIISPLLRDHFSEKEEAAMVERASIIGHMPMSFRGEALAWVARVARQWMLPSELEAFMGALPPPVRFLLKNSWASKHVRNNINLLESITQDVPPPPPAACCVIA
eukprot:tig00020951_g16431.t1